PAHREEPENGQVEVVAARAVELIAADVAEGDSGRLSERARIEPGPVRRDIAAHLPRPDQIRRLPVARRVHARRARREVDRRTAEGREDAVDLPVVDDRLGQAAMPAITLPR